MKQLAYQENRHITFKSLSETKLQSLLIITVNEQQNKSKNQFPCPVQPVDGNIVLQYIVQYLSVC